MAPTQAQSCEVIKLYYECKSLKTVVKTIKKNHPELEKFNTKQVQRIVKRFEESGSVEDRRHTNTGRPRSVRTSENLERVKNVINETPQRSVRRVLGDVSNTMSATSVYRILKFDLQLTPYKVSIMQHLKETDITSRVSFANWMTSNIDIVEKLWFSDEAHFYLNPQINKQNCRCWSTEKPDFYIEKPLHGEKVTVWAALSVDGIVGPFFFEDNDGNVATVNKDRYLHILKSKFIPALRRRSVNMDDVWFQQDGATPHTAGDVINFLTETFGDKFISFKTEREWPPHSPDLNPLDFFLWGHLKERVYNPMPENTSDLKSAIRREMRKIPRDVCSNVINNFKHRLDVIITQNGRHIEHLL